MQDNELKKTISNDIKQVGVGFAKAVLPAVLATAVIQTTSNDFAEKASQAMVVAGAAYFARKRDLNSSLVFSGTATTALTTFMDPLILTASSTTLLAVSYYAGKEKKTYATLGAMLAISFNMTVIGLQQLDWAESQRTYCNQLAEQGKPISAERYKVQWACEYNNSH